MTENSYIPRVYNNGNRTWETKAIPSKKMKKKKKRKKMKKRKKRKKKRRGRRRKRKKKRKKKEEEETTNHLIFHCKILRNQRNKTIKQKTLVAIGL